VTIDTGRTNPLSGSFRVGLPSKMLAGISGIRECGYCLQPNAPLTDVGSYDDSMNSDERDRHVRQHVSADVAPELYLPQEDDR
jgi:hypothetical protein